MSRSAPPDPPLLAVRREFAAQLARAARGLAQGAQSDARVHAIRRELKRARASLRLLRDPLGARAYRRENRRLRDVARPLGRVRDANVVLDTFDRLLLAAGIPVADRTMQRLRHRLQGERDRSRTQLHALDLGAGANQLHAAGQPLRHMDAARLERAPLGRALARSVRKACRSGARARRVPSDARLHEWRKQVKYLSNQLDMAPASGPRGLAKLARVAAKLADHLGDDHDLAELDAVLAGRRRRAAGVQERARFDTLLTALGRRRAKLQRKSFRLGRQLRAARPRRLVRRLDA